jgi:hypothetical protein
MWCASSKDRRKPLVGTFDARRQGSLRARDTLISRGKVGGALQAK